MENLTLDQIIEQMTELIEEAKNLPLSKNIVLNREVMLEYIECLKVRLPKELRQARQVNERKQEILTEAEREAEQALKNAENLISRRIGENEITREAHREADKIMTEAKQTARDIRLGALQYADEVLEGMEREFFERFQEIKQNRKELRNN